MRTSPERVDAKSGIGVKKARQILETVEEAFREDEVTDWDLVEDQRAAYAELLAGVDVADVVKAYAEIAGEGDFEVLRSGKDVSSEDLEPAVQLEAPAEAEEAEAEEAEAEEAEAAAEEMTE